MSSSIGQQRSNHRYIARVPVGSSSYRYFYTPSELAAYKAQKNNPSKGALYNVSLKKKKKSSKGAIYDVSLKKKKKGVMLPEGHMATDSSGRVISGYRPGKKPDSMSDESWNKMRELWGLTKTAPKSAKAKKPKKKSSKSTITYSVIKRR